MMKIKAGILFVAIALFANATIAQNIDDGKQFLYYERYQSAKNVFEKIKASDPKSEEAVYYLGQALIGLEKTSAAKELYLNSMAQMPNSPMILAGVGQIELSEGKTADARQHFETARSLSKDKDVDVLNAIGKANGNYESKNGDAAYAVDVLTRATETRKFKNHPEVYVNLGDAYRKMGNGGEAIKAYDKALEDDKNYARALYRAGRVYQTQGRGQETLYMKYYDDAVALDPKYAPVYQTLFNYFYETDVPRSAQYLDKLVANSDDDPLSCFYKASLKYAQGLFQESIASADACISTQGSDPLPKYYQLKAFAYKRLGDTAMSIKNFDQYFAKQTKDNIQGGDYAAYASVLIGDSNQVAKVDEYTNRAVMMDTVPENKVSYVKNLAAAYEARKNSAMAAKWYARVLDVKKNFNNVDIFNAGWQYYSANSMDSSNKYFKLYTEKYPEEIMGFYMLANGNAILDSTGVLAVPYYTKTIEMGLADTTVEANVNKVSNAYKFFIGHAANFLHDKKMALDYVDKALALTPGDAQLLTYKEALKGMPDAPPAKKNASTGTDAKKNDKMK